MAKNILISSAGKRVSLVRFFQQALKENEIQAKVYTTELKPELSPAAVVSDGCFKVSSVSSPGYVRELFDVCRRHDVGIVIPTIDTELLVLAKHKSMFADHGIDIVVSDPEFISICRDKRNTHVFLESKGIRMPRLMDKACPVFPLFVKPYDGSLSQNTFFIRNQEELTRDILDNPKLILMEYVDPKIYQEFTVDIYYGKDFRLKSIVPRERVAIRAGEINKGFARKNYLVGFLKEKLDYLPGVVGCICVQLFYNSQSEQVIGIEINPRFGGGYPLSYFAGADFPDNIIREYFKKENIGYSDDWIDGTLMLRYDNEVIVYPDGNGSSNF